MTNAKILIRNWILEILLEIGNWILEIKKFIDILISAKITDKKGQVYRNKLISLNNFKQSPVSYPSFNSFPQY